MPIETHRYSNGEVTVIWRPHVCVHSGVCFRGLPKVFDPRRRPWIDIQAASTEEITRQVRHCPSGALSLDDHAGETARPVMAPG